MTNLQKPYTLHKRGKIWYAHFRDIDGERAAAKSTGETSKARAEQWCIDYLQKGQGRIVKRELVTFENFAKGFFDWESDWAVDKRSRSLRISKRHCIERTDILKNHLFPVLGKLKLTAIDRAVIKDFRNNMFKEGYSGNTINKCLSALKAILESAEERSLIQFIPRIDRAAEIPKVKGTLTIEETKQLFNQEWTDSRGYVANLLAASAGLRLGEVQALTLGDLRLDGNYIVIRRSWDKRSGALTETTKTGKTRNIFIPENVKREIIKLVEIIPYNKTSKTFLFYADKIENKPCEREIFTRSLYKALEGIGVSEEERKTRNITFHSWRHFLNSLLINAKIPLQKIQSITGHTTVEMSSHYYRMDEMEDILQITDSLLVNKN